MKIIECVQGDAVWTAARLGVATASSFDRIMTPKTMKLSAGADGYACQLIAEQMLGVPVDGASSGFMARGIEMEQEAVGYYEMQRDVDTQKVGFVLRDGGRVGCSPDRLVGTDGLLEIKCPSAANHIAYMLSDDGIDYRCQVQGQLWVCEREWCDTLSFHPSLPPALVRQRRDEEFIAALSKTVNQFLLYMEEMRDKLARKGYLPDQDFPPLKVVA